MELQLFRGSIALVGETITQAATSTLCSPAYQSYFAVYSSLDIPYHITLISKPELRSILLDPNPGAKSNLQAGGGSSSNNADVAAAPASPDEVLKILKTQLGDNSPQVHFLGLGAHPLSASSSGRDHSTHAVNTKADARTISTSSNKVLYVVCVWAKGQQLRKHLGLPPKHFHVTLSNQDIHDIDKGISTLVPVHRGDASLDVLSTNLPPELLDHLVYTLYLMQDYPCAKQYAIQLCIARGSHSSHASREGSERGFLRLADVAVKTWQHKLAMLSYACAFHRAESEQTKSYCLQKIFVCARETEWGTVFADSEPSELPDKIRDMLVESWSAELRDRISEEVENFEPTLCRDPRERLSIPASLSVSLDRNPRYHNIPRYFRWLVPFHIALMSIPRSELDIAALASSHIGIRHILTLTEESPLPTSWFSRRHSGSILKNTFLPVPDYHPLSVEQIDAIVQLMRDEENLPMLVHCAGGKGRTGVVAACYIAAFGFGKLPVDHVPTEPKVSASKAIASLRAIRPVSVENGEQEACVGKWCSAIWKRQSVFPVLPEGVSEPPDCPMVVEGNLDPTKSNLYIFVGLPGSGKSWTARMLIARNRKSWRWVSQDESGSRSKCENEIGRFDGKTKVILDRCNTSKEDRKSWLSLASHWSVSPVCVLFEYSRDLCVYRAQQRVGHPTLPPGNRVRNAVKQMETVYVRPNLKEGFEAIVSLGSFAAVEEFVTRVSPTVGLLKFPRTEHLINLGAAASDDLILSDYSSTFPSPSLTSTSSLPTQPDTTIIITEKVDGANMGFSLSPCKTRILVQNRSHYVNSRSHDQFKKLDLWVSTHRDVLYRILDRDPVFPQRYVLYGEWLVATHSVEYTNLPDWFMAFDLFDRSEEVWMGRAALVSLIESANIAAAASDGKIKLVPLVYGGEKMPSEPELKEMVYRKSQFCEGPVEGVYVKVEKDGCVIRRGKVVRGDFIAGNEHWTRGGLRLNQLSQLHELEPQRSVLDW